MCKIYIIEFNLYFALPSFSFPLLHIIFRDDFEGSIRPKRMLKIKNDQIVSVQGFKNEETRPSTSYLSYKFSMLDFLRDKRCFRNCGCFSQ